MNQVELDTWHNYTKLYEIESQLPCQRQASHHMVIAGDEIEITIIRLLMSLRKFKL